MVSYLLRRASLVAQGKKSACNEGDLGSIPGLRRSSGERNDYLLQYSGLENSVDCIVHEVEKSQTGLSDFHFHYYFSGGAESQWESVQGAGSLVALLVPLASSKTGPAARLD